MEIYLVGGAVRDFLLNKESKDQDFVVVGSSVQEMQNLGFSEVGKDFPVFLHPETGFEYALARKERKLNKGWGFDLNTTLEEDLIRRDLTINALALPTNNNVLNTKILWSKNAIDFFNGLQDLKNKELRHISPFYAEDPLRIIRTARFASQLDFVVNEQTKSFIRDLSPRLKEIPQDRVWKEVNKALEKEGLTKFWQVMHDCKATDLWFKQSPFLSTFIQDGSNYFRNLINSFIEMPLEEVKKFVLDKEKLNFITCSHSVQKGQDYDEWAVEEKLNFIERTKAIHDPKLATDLLQWNEYIFKLPESSESFKNDLQSLKVFDWAEFFSKNKDGKLVKEQKKKLLTKF